ncbi:MAG: hypothetical protein KY445_11290 [Armatimonadetes bacterium]|nr:hypothetical protein [Armatimonadota bacterium]
MEKNKDIPTRRLYVPLTNDELLDRGQKLARAKVDLDNIESEKKSAADGFKLKIEDKKGEITDLARAINTKQELRPVEVEDRKNYGTAQMETYRLDTQKVIDTRPLTPNEMQTQLDLVS